MKIKNLLKKAEKEMSEEKEYVAVERVKDSLKNLEEAKKVVKVLEEEHKELLEMDVNDLEDDDFEY